ncbi:hypothetical protein GOODEAATRI_027677 [Goodea atripinnis]|uniref:Regulator of G-protein signaling 9-binding protein n=1 Tax=Goodea atripinnis TaxID=208336 RepID=A0ABV0NNP8_9TELE
MSRWRRSVDELTAGRQRYQKECERAQNALSRVTSCFQQLVASLGSSADSSYLREEIDETRALAHRICSGLSHRLLHLLSACDSAPIAVEDRQASERLWVLFLSVVENFLCELQKAKDLIGCTDGLVGLAARMALVQIPWLVLEEEPSPNLTDHIAGLESLLSELQQRVPVAFWSVEATQPAWAEVLSDPDDPEDSLEDIMEVEVVSNSRSRNNMSACCPGKCCRLSCVG